MKKLSIITSILILSLISCTNTNQEQTIDLTTTHGPDKGSLVIVGGAMKDTLIVDRFIELAGGVDAPFVIIPTASGAKEINEERIKRLLVMRGATDVTVLHTYDSLEADTEEFVAPIKRAAGVWFSGGRQWRLVDAYGSTLSESEFKAVLERGGVIGGSSAGATIQGSYLARGDTKTNTIMMGDHERGFGYLSNSAIDQHLLVRNRQHDLVEVIEKHPSLLGIGLDENTAVVVQGDSLEVIGQSFVAIYDFGLWGACPDHKQRLANDGKFFLLRPGDRYNVSTRKVGLWKGGNSRNIFSTAE